MKIVHSFKGRTVSKDVDKASFISTNKIGGFSFLSDKPESRYQGVFFNIDGKVFRTIENISVQGKITEIRNNLYSVERKKDNLIEKFFMPHLLNSVTYELDKVEQIEIIVDVKEIYDNREFGRFYEIEKEKDKVLIKFTKKTSLNEDGKDNEEEYEVWIAVRADNMDFSFLNEWVKRDYHLDKKRNSYPFERYVFKALIFNSAKKIVISVSKNKEEAIKEADMVFKNSRELELKAKKETGKIKACRALKNELYFAYISSINSLNQLTIDKKNAEGIMAGLPWFFQFWSRDELVSLNALKDYRLVKKIILRHINQLGEEDLSDSADGKINAADSIGWLCFRLNELMKKIGFSKKELRLIKTKLEKAAEWLIKNKTKDSLAVNYEKETWMDSLARDGSRIEIQALRLAVYGFLFRLTKNKKYKKLERELKNKVKEKFWNGSYLFDGVDDPAIRPNFFIAAYVYPDLLSKKEWVKCFDYCLPRLWLGFGLSTIDKNDYRFIDKHSGEEPKSYHNGDSWFWLNNLAALAMSKIDKKRFKKYIYKILEASTEEILWKGAVGHHAELSSAKELSSEGCLSQAWSSAMHVELVNSVYNL